VIKKLTRHGNSLALVLDKPILDLLGIDAETPLEVTTDGSRLRISPVQDAARRKKFEEALAEGNKKYGRMLKRLAE
jgi:antitoxin MazE